MKKKNFYAFARVAVLLLATVMTTTTAWAVVPLIKTVKYIDYDAQGNKVETISPAATVINSNNKPTDLSAGWYVVEGPVNYTSGIKLGDGEINIILSDGAELNVGTEENPISVGAIMVSGNAMDDVSLTIYAQSGNTGKLKAIGFFGIAVQGSLTIVGGDVTGKGTNNSGILASGNISAKAATLTAKGPYGIYSTTQGDITLDGCDVRVEDERTLWGIAAQEGNIYIKNDASVVAKGVYFGIIASLGKISIEGGTVTAEGVYYGIYASQDISATDVILTAKGTGAAGLQAGEEGGGSVTLTGGQLDIEGGQLAIVANGGITYSFGEGDKAISVVKAITGVTNVVCSRTFTPGKPSTIMLPFSIAAGNVSGGTFYEFTSVAYNTATQQWEADMDEVTGNTEANTPYVFVPDAETLTFTPDGGVTLNTTENSYSTAKGEWTFTGTYSPLTYGTNLTAPYVYGFAGADQPAGKDAVVAGQFVRAGEGATIPAFRAYLQRADELVAPQAASRSAAAVPDVIVVRLHNADGSVTAISGELKVEDNGAAADYYTIDGRRLGSKPAGKGLYIRNGKKIIVK